MICEICGQLAHHKHHIISKVYGGSNKKHNIALLCGSHHMDVHSSKIVIEGKFLTSDGLKLIWRYKTDETITGFEPKVYIQ